VVVRSSSTVSGFFRLLPDLPDLVACEDLNDLRFFAIALTILQTIEMLKRRMVLSSLDEYSSIECGLPIESCRWPAEQAIHKLGPTPAVNLTKPDIHCFLHLLRVIHSAASILLSEAGTDANFGVFVTRV
jgi:hypothetical protein